MNDFESLDGESRSSDAPHKKSALTTKFGRFLERASYLDIALSVATMILVSAIYYSTFPFGQSLAMNGKNVAPSFGAALYFTVVTFTTLGYGDYVPVGFGRVVASVVVFFGLFVTAVFIGKCASERQQSTLLLIFTSDAQRRLEGFSQQMRKLGIGIEESAKQTDVNAIKKLTKEAAGVLEAAFNYFIFNANQARLIEFGNSSALNAFDSELNTIQKICIAVHKDALPDIIVSDRSLAIAMRLSGLMNIFVKFHHSTPKYASYTNSAFQWIKGKIQREGYSGKKDSDIGPIKLARMMEKNGLDLLDWTRCHLTASLLKKIQVLLPRGDLSGWPKTLHKDIALALGISNSLAQKGMDALIK